MTEAQPEQSSRCKAHVSYICPPPELLVRKSSSSRPRHLSVHKITFFVVKCVTSPSRVEKRRAPLRHSMPCRQWKLAPFRTVTAAPLREKSLPCGTAHGPPSACTGPKISTTAASPRLFMAVCGGSDDSEYNRHRASPWTTCRRC